MSPQFVDFNADGHLDIVAGTFDGSPHVAMGGPKGLAQPSHILDKNGKRIIQSQYWDYKAREWIYLARNNKNIDRAQLISAVAFDWDNDGDLDLLLGDRYGKLYRRMNVGTAKEHKFEEKNIRVLADGKPFEQAGGLTTMRLVDWDGDGRTDLLCGAFLKSYGKPTTSGVVWYRNTGKKGSPTFAAAQTLITIPNKSLNSPDQPQEGLYPEAADVDGDGDLDLLVGAYTRWSPAPRKLSAEEKARTGKLRREVSGISRELSAIYRECQKAAGDLNAKDWREKYAAERQKRSKEITALQNKLRRLQNELTALVPSPQRKPFVWLYLNRAKTAAKAARE